jgi:hypothetical protein
MAENATDKTDARLMLVLLDDPALLRVAVTWPRVPCKGKRTTWATTTPDFEAWARMARSTRGAVCEMAKALQDAGLIRPDGSVSAAVDGVATRELRRRLHLGADDGR